MAPDTDGSTTDDELSSDERRLIDAALILMGIREQPTLDEFAEACRLLGRAEQLVLDGPVPGGDYTH